MRLIRRLHPHLTFANICSALALFIALTGGVAWAATELTKNSVRAKHIAPKQVRAKHIASGQIKPRHLAKELRGGRGSQGMRGPRGPRGPKGDRGPAGEKGSLDGVLMGEAPLTRYPGSSSPFTEIPLGSVNEFSVYAHCMDGVYPLVRIYVRAARPGGIVFAGNVGGNDGAYRFTVAGHLQVHDLTTNASVAMRYGQYSLTVLSADGEIHDIRGIAYVQRSDAPLPYLSPGRACGLNQVSILKASR